MLARLQTIYMSMWDNATIITTVSSISVPSPVAQLAARQICDLQGSRTRTPAGSDNFHGNWSWNDLYIQVVQLSATGESVCS